MEFGQNYIILHLTNPNFGFCKALSMARDKNTVLLAINWGGINSRRKKRLHGSRAFASRISYRCCWRDASVTFPWRFRARCRDEERQQTGGDCSLLHSNEKALKVASIIWLKDSCHYLRLVSWNEAYFQGANSSARPDRPQLLNYIRCIAISIIAQACCF